jgi:hypothetical protein
MQSLKKIKTKKKAIKKKSNIKRTSPNGSDQKSPAPLTKGHLRRKGTRHVPTRMTLFLIESKLLDL